MSAFPDPSVLYRGESHWDPVISLLLTAGGGTHTGGHLGVEGFYGGLVLRREADGRYVRVGMFEGHKQRHLHELFGRLDRFPDEDMWSHPNCCCQIEYSERTFCPC